MANLNEADLPPNLTCLKNVDTILRCPICFEFLSIAMMTKCSHNFCSLCIRKFLSYKLQCPVCNSPTTEQDLRNNRILDDLVTNFKSASSCQTLILTRLQYPGRPRPHLSSVKNLDGPRAPRRRPPSSITFSERAPQPPQLLSLQRPRQHSNLFPAERDCLALLYVAKQ